MQVNRYLKDKHFDHIDHALGRPVDPMGETYRSHFATSPDSEDAKAMAASPHWRYLADAGSLSFFEVTDDGCAALRDHLKAIGDRHRLFSITWAGITITEVAETRSKARYRAFPRASDCDPDLTFAQFQAEAGVRLEARP